MQVPQTVALQDSFLVASTDTLRHGQRILRRGREYRVDYAEAKLTVLDGAAAPGDTLVLSYLSFPLGLKRKYAKRVLRVAGEDTTLNVLTAGPWRRMQRNGRIETVESFGGNLQKSGSLVRGISIGTNQGLKVDSGLRLQLSGKIAEGTEVVAALTDQNTPIQPEGNTQTLNEIDKVFIELRGRQFGATLGDYTLSFGGTEFAKYQRKLQGAMARMQRDNAQVSLFGAVSRGRFRSQKFLGVEGKQGPYQLTGDRGQLDIIVLAGTERVWIDGEPMVRGENNDYVIEYGNGQITFTRNRLITGDSRIIVDFQYSDERFQRNLFGAETAVQLFGKHLQVRGTFIREGDDKGNPIGLALTDADLDALAAAGDSLAFAQGVTEVGAGKGNYILRDSIFVYVGQDSGNYRVRFSDLGEGRGSYQYAGFGNYTYIGPGQGRYDPVVVLPQARRNDLADLRLDYASGGGVNLTTEFALSNFDANLYSRRDDADNSGQAFLVALQLAPERLTLGDKNFGQGRLRLRHRRRGDTYRDLDRENVIEYGRRWDIGTDSPQNGEAVTEADFQYAPWKNLQFTGAVGALEVAKDSINSLRWELGTEWRQGTDAGVRYRVEKIRRKNTGAQGDNTWLRQRGRAHRLFWKLRPSFEIENEVKKNPAPDSGFSGFRFTEMRGGLALEKWRPVTAQVSLARRIDDNRIGIRFKRKSVATTQSFKLSLRHKKNLLATASYIHREREFADSLTQDTRADLAELRLSYNTWRRAVQADAQYQITNKQVNRQERVFFKVREGEGNYRFDAALNEYFPDPIGDYILRMIPTDEFIPVVELRSRMQIRFRPAIALRRRKKLSAWQKLLMPVSTETLLRIEEKSRDPHVREIYMMNFSRYQNPEFTLLGNISLRQDVFLFQNRRSFSLRYRLLTGKSLNNQLLEGEQRRVQQRHELRLTLALTRKLVGQFEIIRSREDRTFAQLNRQDRFVRGLRLETDLSYRPEPRLELAARAVFGNDQDRAFDPATKVTRFSLKPRTTYSFRGRGRFRGELEWTRVTASPGDRVLPYELAQGNRVGTTFRWSLTFDYRVSRNLNAAFSYQGRDEPDRPRTIHLAKAEMRAFF